MQSAAPRSPWSHSHRQEVSRSWKGTRLQSHHCWTKEDMEETQHPQLVEIPISVGLLCMVFVVFRANIVSIPNFRRMAGAYSAKCSESKLWAGVLDNGYHCV